jgi:HSP20 family protein
MTAECIETNGLVCINPATLEIPYPHPYLFKRIALKVLLTSIRRFVMFGYLTDFESGLFDEFRRLEREMDQLFGAGPAPSGIRSASRGSYPPVNIGITADQVDVYLFAAGIDPDKLDISIQHNLLSIKGRRDLIDLPEGAEVHRRELFNGDFQRVLTLPEDVDQERVDASYREGVLHITVQRRESAKPRLITIN